MRRPRNSFEPYPNLNNSQLRPQRVEVQKSMIVMKIYHYDRTSSLCWARVQKLFWGLLILTNNFCFLSFALFLLYHVGLSSWVVVIPSDLIT